MLTLYLAMVLAQPPATTSPKVAEVVAIPLAKPEEFTASVGRFKRIRSEDAKARWELAAGTTGAEIITDDKGGVAFTAEKAGRYTLVCYTSGPATWVVITVGGDSPTPPNPPSPPQPPTPPPPSPKPVDPTVAAIRECFAKDAGDPKAKREDAAQLAALWEEGAKLCEDASVKTAGDLVERLRKTSASLAKDRLSLTRKSIGEATAKLFGSPTAELTAANRKAAKELFELFGSTLEELSK